MIKKQTIAVVDDEPDIVELIQYHLEKENYKVDTFYDGETFLKYIDSTIPDLNLDIIKIFYKIR